MAGLYEQAFKDLIVDKYDRIEACKTANRFFGKDNANFVAIDGTEYSKLVFDMIIFMLVHILVKVTLVFQTKRKVLMLCIRTGL